MTANRALARTTKTKKMTTEGPVLTKVELIEERKQSPSGGNANFSALV